MLLRGAFDLPSINEAGFPLSRDVSLPTGFSCHQRDDATSRSWGARAVASHGNTHSASRLLGVPQEMCGRHCMSPVLGGQPPELHHSPAPSLMVAGESQGGTPLPSRSHSTGGRMHKAPTGQRGMLFLHPIPDPGLPRGQCHLGPIPTAQLHGEHLCH